MNQRTVFCLALFALHAWLPQAQAHDSGLQKCAGIASVLDRLDCYDALAQAEAAATASAAPAPTAPPASAPAAPPPSAPAALPPVAAAAPAVVADATPAPAPPAETASREDEFGFEERRIEEGPREIRSRYDGDFSGWTGKTLFKLENGQVWKQAEKGRMIRHRNRPEVTIRKGAFGSFRLSVEGVKKSVRVTRVK